MKAGTCFHYTGAFNDKTCGVGIVYRALVGGDRSGWITRLPCIPMEAKDGEKASCPMYREPTVEEIAESQRQQDEAVRRVLLVFAGNVGAWRAANKWDRRNPKAAEGKVPCEACGTGEIHLTMSAYNGHVHGACTTEGCVTWME